MAVKMWRRLFRRLGYRQRLAVLLILVALVPVVSALVADVWLWPLPHDKLTRPHSQFVYARGGEMLGAYASSDGFWRRPVRLEDLSERLVQTVLVCEDRWFYVHPGVNPLSLLQAAWDNVRAGRVVRGGSTISMQIARMMEPKERTVGSKLVEILRALQLEWHYSKEQLLECYFNMVPYGGNIEGAGAASWFYFGKDAGELTWAESAVLAGIPVSPNRYRPDRAPEECRKRRDRILRLLAERGVITPKQLQGALSEQMPQARLERPDFAPHVRRDVAAMFPDSSVLVTSIDFQFQRIAERLARRHAERLAPDEVHNLSVVVVDNATREVVALVGSADFNDRRHHGQINGALAPRSPGSALKPFVYALGFETGQVAPLSRLPDVPVDYSGYRPENYDEGYRGVVSVTEALVQSYNIPAVTLASRVGLEKVFDVLQASGVSTLREHYYDHGLPLVLGGCEVKLAELTNAYAVLASGGEYRPLAWLAGSSADTAIRVLSGEACWLVTGILAELERPDLPASWEFTEDLPRVAWKTGTSYGRRDAWTIGYNPHYTIGVWAGNFSGEGSVDLVGAESAAPVMFDLFNQVMRGRDPVWFARPEGVSQRLVCAESGMPPNDPQAATVWEEYIPGVSPSAPCNVHQTIFVDTATGYRLLPACVRDERAVRHRVAIWPPRIATWLDRAGQIAPLPPLSPDCRGQLAAEGPVISSPVDDARFVLQSGRPREYQKIPLVASSETGGKLHWFVDRELLASGRAGEALFYAPEPGRHTLLCVDDQGRSAEVRIVVEGRR